MQYVNNGNDSDHTGQQQHHWHYDEATAIQSLVLMSMFSDAVSQEIYDADLAGTQYSIGSSADGLVLCCGSYSDRLPDLALEIMKNYFWTASSSMMDMKE